MTVAGFLGKWRALPALQSDAGGDGGLSKQQRTRRRLLAHAMQLFEDKGYAATTVPDIAAAAGVSRATFFIHFPTKAALLSEMSRVLAERWHEQPDLPGEPPEERLVRFFTFLLCESSGGAMEIAVLRDFIETYGDDMSAGAGEGTLHAYMEAIITDLARERGWRLPWTVATLGHYFLASFNRLRMDLDGHPDMVARSICAMLIHGADAMKAR